MPTPLRALAVALLLVPAAVPAAVHAQPRDTAAVTNQNLFDITPFLPALYAERVARFEAEPVVTGRTIFLGNSITQGGDWPRLTGDSTAVNRGIGGDITFGVLDRLGDVVRRRPAKLFLLIGINDIGKDIPDAVIADNVRRIVEAVRAGSPETTVYVQSILPVNPAYPGFPQHYDKEIHVVRTNELLREVAAATGTHFVNLYPLFLDRLGYLDARFTGDGLHLNDAGYARWVRHLKESGYL